MRTVPSKNGAKPEISFSRGLDGLVLASHTEECQAVSEKRKGADA
jgi:hypothetical protein